VPRSTATSIIPTQNAPPSHLLPSLAEDELDGILDYLEQHDALARSYKRVFLARRVAARMRARVVETGRDYLQLLHRDACEGDRLIASLSIRHSYFLRDANTFRALREQFLAPLFAERTQRGKRYFRAWSAGCASGEEPYSLAILCAEILQGDRPRWDLRILGTDVSATALEQAQGGLYTEDRLRNLAPALIQRYFTRADEGYRVHPEICTHVSFMRQNVFDAPARGHFDLILCRNVLIYLAREQQDRLFRLFHSALTNPGLLIVGKTETLSGSATSLFKCINPRERLYLKEK
jgi:chemotaxis protein methyltransferase CheR